MKASAIITASLLVAHKIDTVVVSPGSRNAPLIEAMHRCPDLKLIDIIDERTAAFVALGIARQSHKAVALVCTSGTAVLNYAPAVAEAYYQGLPLIVISADRPMQWIDQDDSQTIHQSGALRNFVKGSFNIPDFSITDNEMRWYCSRTVNEAILLSNSRKQGPVHVNIQFNAPLIISGNEEIAPQIVRLLCGSNELSLTQAQTLACTLQHRKVLIVAGYMSPSHKLTKVLNRFLTLPNVALLPEGLANLHIPEHGGIDRILTGIDEDTLQSLLPDVVITIGGALLSRKVKEWLRSAPSSMEHWCLDQADTLADCFCHLTLKITTDTVQFFSRTGHCLAKLQPQSDYGQRWREIRMEATASASSFCDTLPWSDLYAHRCIFRMIPESWNVCCSNGTSIRYAELFASPMLRQLSCNRGTSGIEGCTSTAIGQAMTFSGITLLITGDMSLRHDLTALALPSVPDSFKVIVFSNGGGDIFRFIPTTSELNDRELHFSCAALCDESMEKTADAVGYRYLYAESPVQLTQALDALINSKTKTILEINTKNSDNASVLKTYMARIKHRKL